MVVNGFISQIKLEICFLSLLYFVKQLFRVVNVVVLSSIILMTAFKIKHQFDMTRHDLLGITY